MEFIAKIPDNLPEIIENNGEEVKAWLSEVMQKYDGLVVTPESIKSAKEDKAKLNKLRTALEERRKEVKRDYLAPYMAFEEKYKELLALIDKPIASIDDQIKVFEQKELDAKYAEIEQHFKSCMAGIDLPIVLDKIINPKWQNKTMKTDTLKREISDRIEQISEEVKGIRYAYGDTPHLTAVLKCYYEGYDAGAAHVYANALINEQHRQEARAQNAQEAPQAAPAPVPETIAPPPQNAVQKPPASAESVPSDGKLYTCTFKATGTREQLRTARDNMLSIGLKIESV